VLIPQFKFSHSADGEFRWTTESKYEQNGQYRIFFAVGRSLAYVKRFARIVRWCERTGKVEDLAWHVEELERSGAIQSTWGGNL